MRWFLALLLVTGVCACRRGASAAGDELQAEAPDPAIGSPVHAEEPPGLAEKPPVAAGEPPVAPAPAPPAAERSAPSPAVSDRAPPADTSRSGDASPFDEEGAIFRWTDAQGVTHYTSGADVPDDQRAAARRVSGGLTVVESGPSIAPAPPAASVTSEVRAEAVPDEAEPAPREPGEAPELDADGLPIPGTMRDTAHTRTIRQATGVQLDPAALERRYQEQLREMKCVEKDGAIVCG